MGDGGLQVCPITLIGGSRNSERRLPGIDGFGVREGSEIQERFCAIGGVLELFGGQFDGGVVFADGLLDDLLGFDFIMPCGGFSEGAKQGGVIMSVKRLFGVELNGLVERAECLLNAAGLTGLQGNGAEVYGEVVQGSGIFWVGFKGLFPLINRPLAVINVSEETAIGNACPRVVRVALQEIRIQLSDRGQSVADAQG